MKKILLILILLFTSKIYSQNNDFVYVTSAKDGTEVYVKQEDEVFNTKHFWIKMTNPVKKVKSKSGKYIKSGGGYTMQFMKLDCSDKTYSTSDGVMYNTSGKVVREVFDLYNERVIPGSIMEGIYNYVCLGE